MDDCTPSASGHTTAACSCRSPPAPPCRARIAQHPSMAPHPAGNGGRRCPGSH